MTITDAQLAELRHNQRTLTDMARELRRLAAGHRDASDLARYAHDAANYLEDSRALIARVILEAAALEPAGAAGELAPGPKACQPAGPPIAIQDLGNKERAP